jgi:predicted nuclease with TOPRIM domain
LQQARLSDGKAIYDDSFPIALDENFEKIKAVEAKKLKERFPKATFYCPKCYKLDPNNKTEVYPSNHETPRFNRCHGEAHLDSCQYKNAGQYLSTVSQKLQVNINGKDIELSLMPYEGRGIFKKPLGSKIRHYTRPGNKKFMELVSEILTDYEMEYFHKKYNSYKVGCEGGKAKPFRDLFRSIETAKANSFPFEEKLNIIVGQIESVDYNDHYILIDMDSSHSPYDLRLYLDRYFYDPDALSQLEGKRIACMGYIQKPKDELYLMEIVSMPHQIAILDDVSFDHLAPQVQTKELSSFLKKLTAEFREIEPKDFYRSYYKHQLEQLEASVNEEITALQESVKGVEQEKLEAKDQLMKVEQDLTGIQGNLNETQEEIRTINDVLSDIEKKISACQSGIYQLEKENIGLLNRIRNIIKGRTPEVIQSEIEENRRKIQDHEKRRQQEQERLDLLHESCSALKDQLHSLEKDQTTLQESINTLNNRLSQLQSQINDLKRQVKIAKEKADKEKKIKETFEFYGQVFELIIGPNWSILIDIAMGYVDLSVECSVASYCVEKKDGFYIPYEYHHQAYKTSSYKRTTQSSRHNNVRKTIEVIQGKLSEDIKQLSSLITDEL